MPLRSRGINIREINSKMDEIRAILDKLNVKELNNIFIPPVDGQSVKKLYVKDNKLQVDYEE